MTPTILQAGAVSLQLKGLQKRAIIVNYLFGLPAASINIQTEGQGRVFQIVSPFKQQQIFSASGPGRAFKTAPPFFCKAFRRGCTVIVSNSVVHHILPSPMDAHINVE